MIKVKNPKTVLVLAGILIFLLGVGLGMLIQPVPLSPSFPNEINGRVEPSTIVPTAITIQGSFLCLPHRDTTGPQPLECAFGLKTADNTYYALDLSKLSEEAQNSAMNATYEVQGIFVALELLSNDHWQKYPIRGIIQAEKFTRLAE